MKSLITPKQLLMTRLVMFVCLVVAMPGSRAQDTMAGDSLEASENTGLHISAQLLQLAASVGSPGV